MYFLLIFVYHLSLILASLSRTSVLIALLQNKDLPIENATDCLSTMASICCVMIENPYVVLASCVFVATNMLFYLLLMHSSQLLTPVPYIEIVLFVLKFSVNLLILQEIFGVEIFLLTKVKAR